MEEAGELAHCHLKERQNIRGTPEQHQAGAKDALGDLSVYLLGVLRYTGKRPHGLPESLTSTKPTDRALSRLAHSVGLLGLWDLGRDTFDPQGAINRIVSCCDAYCDARGWDYEAIVWETWNGVKKRDWIKYPDTGLPQYGHLSCGQCGGSAVRRRSVRPSTPNSSAASTDTSSTSPSDPPSPYTHPALAGCQPRHLAGAT
jgi:hypothetical protein